MRPRRPGTTSWRSSGATRAPEMGFLRRLLGGGSTTPDDDPLSAPEAAEEEQAREQELLRAESERLADPLIQRQLRYADRAWSPPAQGGERRADVTEDPAP